MRLDELKFDFGDGLPWDQNPATVGIYYVWRSPEDIYTIRKIQDTEDGWWDIDPFTAQAVLFEICPVNPLNQNGTIEPYLPPTTSLEKSDT